MFVFFSDSSNSSWDLILGYKHELIMRLLHHILFEKKQKFKTKQNKTEQNKKEKKRLENQKIVTRHVYTLKNSGKIKLFDLQNCKGNSSQQDGVRINESSKFYLSPVRVSVSADMTLCHVCLYFS